ncbi:Phosphoethanolamine N-methyltransferase [Trichoplax sp. H2]|nr:Phosphoethanolamine N-methyltransferase [Trichoplax sp. H2]|eukprot:RDD37167.1 Phosphoethanolamine N-methyltransferase [Trichoplax sp. H2]
MLYPIGNLSDILLRYCTLFSNLDFNPNRIYKQLENINKTFQVLDFGSGIGGPARHLASKSRCRVKAVEIQEDLNKIAADLTNRCGLSDRIDHVRQDIYKLDTDSNYFDCAVSWLAVNHIEDKAGLFKKLFTMLKKGGKIYIEDFYQKGPVTENEREILFIEDLPTIEEYRKYLVDAGFINIEILNVTSSWIKFVTNRAEVFANERAQNCASFGEETVNSLQDFYDGMKSLYDTNTIGGVQIYAQSPNN